MGGSGITSIDQKSTCDEYRTFSRTLTQGNLAHSTDDSTAVIDMDVFANGWVAIKKGIFTGVCVCPLFHIRCAHAPNYDGAPRWLGAVHCMTLRAMCICAAGVWHTRCPHFRSEEELGRAFFCSVQMGC